MCLARVYPKSEIEKLPETIIMWRLFRKDIDGVLKSVNQGHTFKLGTNVAPKAHLRYRENGKGFHCFMSRKEARQIRNLYLQDEWPKKHTIRKVIVNRKDVKALGRTDWTFYYPLEVETRKAKTETAVVKRMTILPTKEGR